MFVQRLDLTTGQPEWVQVSAEGDADDDQTSAVSQLVHSSLYLDMLHDALRNDQYRLGLERAVRPGSTVLDIGTGTGLLALLALQCAKAGAQDNDLAARVTACESFLPMVKIARRVLAANSASKHVRVINQRSDELSVGMSPGQAAGGLDAPVDVIVTEIFDSELLGEGVLPTMRHAVANLLKPGGRVVPAGATLYCQIVQCAKLHQDFMDPADLLLRSTVQFPHDQWGKWPLRALHLDALYPQHLLPLTEPIPLFTFDFLHPPGPEGRQMQTQVPAVRSGAAHAVVFWWHLYMNDLAARAPDISTAPAWISAGDPACESSAMQQQWRDHWRTCWTPIVPAFDIDQGGMLTVSARHGDVDVYVTCVPTSTRQSGMGQHHLQFIRAAGLQGRVHAAVLSDDPGFVVRIAAQPGIDHVTLFLAAQQQRQRVHKLASMLNLEHKVTCHNESALGPNPRQAQAGQLHAAKPYITVLDIAATEKQLPWHALRLWMQAHALREQGHLPVTPFAPASGRLMAVGMCLPDLHRTCSPLTSVQGFDLSVCNAAFGVAATAGEGSSLLGPITPRLISQCGGELKMQHVMVWRSGWTTPVVVKALVTSR
ncbi:hypothetical protein WJX73_008967 [Symbiochloris irregularis]|uniref:Protein arginine N-methyltransferase 7 n=1 Tax=Symbiochloris irregularis TaxID=706552 RepID=A0AAW1NLZ5_9CHLO